LPVVNNCKPQGVAERSPTASAHRLRLVARRPSHSLPLDTWPLGWGRRHVEWHLPFGAPLFGGCAASAAWMCWGFRTLCVGPSPRSHTSRFTAINTLVAKGARVGERPRIHTSFTPRVRLPLFISGLTLCCSERRSHCCIGPAVTDGMWELVKLVAPMGMGLACFCGLSIACA